MFSHTSALMSSYSQYCDGILGLHLPVISSFQPLFPTAVHAISNSHSLLLFVCSFFPSFPLTSFLSLNIYGFVFFHSLFHSSSPISFRFPDAIVHRTRCQQFSSTFIPSWYWNWYWNWYELQSLSSSSNVCSSAKKVRTQLERIKSATQLSYFLCPYRCLAQ